MYVNFEQTDWDQKVPMAGLAINTSKQSSTGFTPFELLYGRSAVLPANSAFPWPTQSPERVEEFRNRVNRWRKQARLLVLKRQSSSKRTTDKRRQEARPFEPGDLVLVARKQRAVGKTAKLLPRFIGPLQVVRKQCEMTYLVEDIRAKRTNRRYRRFNAHVCQMRAFHARTDYDWDLEVEKANSIEKLTAELTEDQPSAKTTSFDERVSRSGRRLRPPAWQQDYMTKTA